MPAVVSIVNALAVSTSLVLNGLVQGQQPIMPAPPGGRPLEFVGAMQPQFRMQPMMQAPIPHQPRIRAHFKDRKKKDRKKSA